MSELSDLERFKSLGFEDFKKMASDSSLKPYQKIGFPSLFREGHDALILEDIKKKVEWSSVNKIVDIGCGCGELTKILISDARKDGKNLVLIDSIEVLNQIPEDKHVLKAPGQFPRVGNVEVVQGADVVISYSVFHYVFSEGNIFEFIDEALKLLTPGGKFLLGDIPNISKRNRFLSSPAGEAFHKKLMKTENKPVVAQYTIESGKIDDALIAGLLLRYRSMGVETYLLPQPDHLPLSTTREDILFIMPK